jgi:hypothetical protein
MVTQVSPSDLPEGTSPDNQDVVYLPGNVASRPAMQAISNSFPAGGPYGKVPTVNYGKSFVAPDGTIRNLFLDSNGGLWSKDLTNNPTVYNFLIQTQPFSSCKSVTAFGREYIAISDGSIGAEVPLQFDGTNVDRVTQDGPGTPPNVTAYSLPAVAMLPTGALPVLTIVSSQPSGDVDGQYFTTINVSVSGIASASVAVGSQATFAGSSSASLNGIFQIIAVYDGSNSLIVVQAYLDISTPSGAGGTVTAGGGITMVRSGNLVTVNTQLPHNMKVGYQTQIAGVPAMAVGTGIIGIAIRNDESPGLATITMSTPHGLVPGTFITLKNVGQVIIGGGISSISRNGQIVTCTTAAAMGISPGAVVTIAGVTDPSFNATVPVLQVISANTIVYSQVGADAGSTGGNVQLNFPLYSGAAPNYFEVISVLGPTQFQIEVNYSDGSWTSGDVTYAWDGRFFVSGVPSTTSFQYQQFGPNATASAVGTVTPVGQVAVGRHQCQLHFLTRQGYITRPSPPVTFTSNGGQFLSVTNIATGPPNVVARILSFTGANGAYFFYIPVPAQINGQIVSTATQINDNTTTSVGLDFSDNTLFASLGVSIPGNNLSNQIILDGALGFGFYGSRLIAYGQRNRIQNFLNMGFEGGALPSAPTLPTGWQLASGSAGTLATGHLGGAAWQVAVISVGVNGVLQQPAFQDAYGAPILTANTNYSMRAWLKPSVIPVNFQFVVDLFSPSTGFVSRAIITPIDGVSTAGAFVDADFNIPTPNVIPPDMAMRLFVLQPTVVAPYTVLVDELSIIYKDKPQTETLLFGSYVNNPEGFDGVSGKFGPSMDTRKVMDFAVLRDNFYMLTQDPSGRLHEVTNNGITEPAGWSVVEIGANCGTLSPFAMTRSNADDATASGGEEWFAWASSSGARIFGGDQPWKISQEIQPDWDRINFSAQNTIWAMNDPVGRVIYFGLPTQLGANVSPDLIYPIDYRELDTAYEIAKSPPIHTSSNAGRLVATDITRKWTRWNVKMNGAALMYNDLYQIRPVFFGGCGQRVGSFTGFGNSYILQPNKYTDDDYGRINSYYVTYFFVNHDAEMALGLSAGRKLVAYVAALITGVGNLLITPLINSLNNPWPLVCERTLNLDSFFDLEWAGGSAQGQRIAFKIQATPITGTDNYFNLSKLIPAMRKNRLPVRGSAA